MMYLDQNGKKRFTSKITELLRDPDIIKVMSILKNEKLSDLVDCDGITFLHLSAQYRNKFLINHLIYNKVFDINAMDRLGYTALMLLIDDGAHYDSNDNNKIDTLKTFLNAGADLWYFKNKFCQSALILIIDKYRHRKDILKLVMDEIEKRCNTVTEIADALLTAGCNLFHVDFFRKTEITKLLLKGNCKVDTQGYGNNTALHIAAKMNDMDNVKVLLQAGAKKCIANSERRLPIACIPGNMDAIDPELIIMLLPDDEDWMVKGDYMNRIFSKCHQGVLENLIYHQGIDLNTRDIQGRLPLHYLVQNKDIQIGKLLKNLMLDINVKDNTGQLPMHAAAKAGNDQAIEYLIDAGTNVNILDEQGKSPLCYIFSVRAMFYTKNIKSKYKECAEILLLNGADVQQLLVIKDDVISRLQMYDDFYVKNLLSHYLAILEAHESTLTPITLKLINGHSPLKNFFVHCQQELDELKKKTFCNSVTLFQFLTEDDEKIRKYARNEEIVKEFSKFEGTSYYCEILKRRFEEALDVNRFKKKTEEFISEYIKPLQGCNLVIEKILDFLRVIDLKVIANMSMKL